MNLCTPPSPKTSSYKSRTLLNRDNFSQSRRENQGFALIATISVMVLLVMIALAMLSLSTIELRSGYANKHQEIAKANARMALMIALGELQKYAGADQRVTARADIHKETVPSKKFWTGVWNTEEWKPTDPDTKVFENWLVSTQRGRLSEEDVKNDFIDADLITLLGAGSVLAPEDQVQVEKVSVFNHGKKSGTYAYWVGDEGIKASYRVPALNESDWNQAGILGTAAKSGISSLGFDGYEDLSEEKLYSGSVTRQSVNLSSADKNLSRQFFHDVTPQAISLLTDTRLGGVRRDLSTAFELPRDQFNALAEFHAANENNKTGFYDELGGAYLSDSRFYAESNSPNLGYVCEIPWTEGNSQGFVRGASWDLIRNHYRLYKKEWEANPWDRMVGGIPSHAFAARGSLPHSYSGKADGPLDQAGTAGNDIPGDNFAYHTSNGHIYGKRANQPSEEYAQLNLERDGLAQRTIARSPQLTPVVLRMTIALTSMRLKGYNQNLYVALDPYVTIMNPYNVPITFSSIGLWAPKFTAPTIAFEWTKTDGSLGHRTLRTGDFSWGYYSQGTFTFRLDPAEGPFTLEPGEIKVLSPKDIPGAPFIRVNNKKITTLQGSLSYGEDSRYYVTGRVTNIKPKENTKIKVTVTEKQLWDSNKEHERFSVYLLHAKNHDGSARNLLTEFNTDTQLLNMFSDEDSLDQPQIANIGFNLTGSKTQGGINIVKHIDLPPVGQKGQALVTIDVRMKTLKAEKITSNGPQPTDFPSLSFNPRGGAFDPRDYDSSDRSSPQWAVDISPLDDIAQLQLVVDPDGHGLWGEGRSTTSGVTHAALYEVPQLPISSLAQLQHVNTGVTGSSGSLQIGNSFSHLGIADLDTIVTQRNNVANGYSSKPKGQVLSDMGWASNEALWDRYFFSGINWGNSSGGVSGTSQPYATHQEAIDALIAGDRTKAWPLQNPRMDLFSRRLTTSQKNELLDYDKLARYLAVFGGFNVNSTSEKAWQAVFSSLRKVDIPYWENGGSSKTETVTQAFSRMMLPTQKKGALFGGFRELSDTDIENLSKAMVVQVKTRGPFMGLADFVNRRLTKEDKDGTDVGAVGALQAAIEASGLNGSSIAQKPTAGNLENLHYKVDGTSHDISTYAGTAGYLLQADVLSSIGGILSARSDTFVIRTYGESLDSAGNVKARAWCEATVQRTPDWLEPTGEAATHQSSSYPNLSDSPILKQWERTPEFPEINTTMGRQFKILSFRWLSSDEV